MSEEKKKKIVDYYYNPNVECTCGAIFDDTHRASCKRRERPKNLGNKNKERIKGDKKEDAKKLHEEIKDIESIDWLTDYIFEFLDDEDALNMKGQDIKDAFWKLYIKQNKSQGDEK